MKDPERLLDDETAPPGLRDALRAAAQADPAYDVAAGLARFQGTLAAGPKPGPSTLLRAVAIGGAVVLVAGLALLASRLVVPAHVAPTPAPLAPSPILPASPAQPPPAARTETPVPVAPAPVAPETTVRTPLRAADPLALEVRLVVEARRNTRTVPARSLALLARADREVGEGVLGAERETLRVEALVALGRTDEAARRARAFLVAHPGDPLETRVRAAVAPQR